MAKRRLPSKEEIRKKALELFYKDQPEIVDLAKPKPTDEELKKWGYWERARRLLMKSEATKAEEEMLKYIHEDLKSELEEYGYIIVEEGGYIKPQNERDELLKENKRLMETLRKIKERLEVRERERKVKREVSLDLKLCDKCRLPMKLLSHEANENFEVRTYLCVICRKTYRAIKTL